MTSGISSSSLIGKERCAWLEVGGPVLPPPWLQPVRGGPLLQVPWLLPSQEPRTPPSSGRSTSTTERSCAESWNPLGWHYEDWKDTRWVVIDSELGPWFGRGAPSMWWVLRATHGPEQGVAAGSLGGRVVFAHQGPFSRAGCGCGALPLPEWHAQIEKGR